MAKEVVESVVEMSELSKIKGKYIIKPIMVNPHLLRIDKNHDGANIFSKAFHYMQASKDKYGVTVTGMNNNNKLQYEFENALNLQPGTLSQYNDKYWGGYRDTVTNMDHKAFFYEIPKDGLLLDCDNNVKHKLIYTVIKGEIEATSVPKFAMSYEAAKLNPFCLYVLENTEVEANVRNKQYEIKDKAIILKSTLSIQQKMDFLTVYADGKFRVSNNTLPNLISEKVSDIVEKDPSGFINLLENPLYKEFIFVQKLVRDNIITKSGPKLFTKEGELIGNSLVEAANNLNTPDYNEMRLSLITKSEVLNK